MADARPAGRAVALGPESVDDEVTLNRALKAARDRYDDLRWCGKADLCNTKAEGARLAIEDIEYEFRVLATESRPDSEGTDRD